MRLADGAAEEMEESIFCVGWDGDQMGGLLVVLLFKRKPNCEKNDRLLHNGTQGLVGWYLSEWWSSEPWLLSELYCITYFMVLALLLC